jgi:hypothetical protein
MPVAEYTDHEQVNHFMLANDHFADLGADITNTVAEAAQVDALLKKIFFHQVLFL